MCDPLLPLSPHFLALFPTAHTHLAHCPPQHTALLPAAPTSAWDPTSLPPTPWAILPRKLLGQSPCVLEGAWATIVLLLPPTTSLNQTAEELATLQPTHPMASCLTKQASQEKPPDLPGGSSISLKPVSVIKGTISPLFMCQKLLAI